MNKRQRKKKFKQRYGMTPKEAEKFLNVDFYEAIRDITPKIVEAINTFTTQVVEMAKAAMEAINEGMADWSKAIERYADNMHTEEMLRGSLPIHPDLDEDLKNRLVLREICKDSMGYVWKFYWDPANEVMYAQDVYTERREKDAGNNMGND